MGCACKKKVNRAYADGDTVVNRGKFIAMLLNIPLYLCVFVIITVLMPVLIVGLFISFVFKKPFDADIFRKIVKTRANG